MSKHKHTPGPWTALPEECDNPYVRIRGTRLGRRFKIANVMNAGYDDQHEREVEETRANAALIAAAPELLEALQEVFMIGDRLVSDVYGYEFKEKARAAIAKATGGTA
jgi:uncharacterized NAD-dependent epimerase/dehydratase family protein